MDVGEFDTILLLFTQTDAAAIASQQEPETKK